MNDKFLRQSMSASASKVQISYEGFMLHLTCDKL